MNHNDDALIPHSRHKMLLTPVVISLLFILPLTGCLDGGSPDASNQVVQPQGILPAVDENSQTNHEQNDANATVKPAQPQVTEAEAEKANSQKMKPLPKKHNGVVIDAGTLDNLVTEAANSGQYYQADEVPNVNQETGQLDVSNN